MLADADQEEIVYDFSPEQLIRQSSSGLELCDSGLKYLEQFTNPICVVMFVGLGQEERVALLQTLFHSADAAVDCSKSLVYDRGIIVLGCSDCMSSGKCIVFMDLNEQEHADGQTHDPQLISLAMSLSSMLVYFHRGKASPSTLHMLRPLSDIIEAHRLEFPSMLWIMTQTDEYSDLERPELIYPARKVALPPTTEYLRSQLAKLKHKGEFHRPEWTPSTSETILRLILSCSTEKVLFDSTLSGDTVVLLLKEWVDQLNSNGLDFIEAYDAIVKVKCQTVATDGLNTYKECLVDAIREDPPMSSDSFQSCHVQMMQVALDMYHCDAKYKSPSRRKIKRQLLQDIEALRQANMEILTRHSREFCSKLQQELRDTFMAQLEACQTFEEFTSVFKGYFDACCGSFQGPARETCLIECLQQDSLALFSFYQTRMMKQAHGAALATEREALEQSWAKKKKELVIHFQQQEKNLRAGLAQEQATFAKIKSATESRLKIGEGERNRLHTEIEKQSNRVKQLEASMTIQQHTIVEKDRQLADMQNEMKRLNETLSAEREAADVVRQLLQETLEAMKQRDVECQEKIQESHDSVGQIRQQHQAQLDEARVKTSKIREERDVLQKKLGDFFLRISALPESLQHQFFCIDQAESVEFADVLSSYMAEESN